MHRWFWLAGASMLCALPAFCSEWNARSAADYLDSRQQEWLAWPRAKSTGGACFSCHTNMTYMLARPMLRQALGESGPTEFEFELLSSLKSRLGKREPRDSVSLGAESVLSALALVSEDASSAEALAALDRMWSLQRKDEKGPWPWYSLDLDPWEAAESRFYGATLAALAAGRTPAAYRMRPEVRANIATLTGYLQREQSSQPLHNRLMLLWASARLPEALSKPARKAMLEVLWREQQADGGWTLTSLGPWKQHASAPPMAGSNSYATALTAFVLEQSGVKASDARVEKALAWLRSHQNREGYWAAESMNKRYEEGSMQIRFMQDAATAFAAMALVGAEAR